MAISGKSVAVTATGFVLFWSGVQNATLASTLKSLLAGHSPAKVTEQAPSLGVASGGTTAAAAAGSTTAPTVAGSYDNAQLQQLWTSCGGDPAKASVAACIGGKESSGQPKVTSANPDGGENVGIWQLDTKGKGAGYSVAQLQDPQTNCRVTIMASRNGTDWSAWATAGDCGV